MNAAWLVLLTLAGVPEVSAGPELAEKATLIDAPIARVTVYSDRARVTRRAKLQQLAGGVQALRLPDLPGAVLLDTLRVTSTRAKVLRVEATPVERERSSIDQVEGLLAKLEEMGDRIAALDRRIAVYDQERSLLSALAPRPPVPEAEREGQPAPPLAPDAFQRVLDFIEQRSLQASTRKLELSRQRRMLAEQMERLQREVQRQELGAFSDRRVQVVALLDAPRPGESELELEYFVPGARWRPSYDLHYLPEPGQVSLHTAGRVEQATGEDWDGVELFLSTAIPGQGIELPELLTWALGEQREYVPRPAALQRPVEPQRYVAPAPALGLADREKAVRRELLGQRLAELERLLTLDPGAAGRYGVLVDFDEASEAGALDGLLAGEGEAQPEVRPMAPPPPPVASRAAAPKPRPAPAPPPAATAMAPPSSLTPLLLKDGEALGQSARGARAEMLTDLVEQRGLPAGPDGNAYGLPSTSSLSLFEPAAAQPPAFDDPTLPAVLAGGLDYVYACPTRAAIPSTGEGLIVPLSVASYPVEAFYVAAPALKDTAFLRAEVKNGGERPILGGPVNIFVGTDFAGQGELQTTGPGGVLRLPLGADEDIRLKRTVVPSSDTEGFIDREDVTTYTTTIEVGNFKKRPIRIAIIDQLPKSGQEEIQVKREKTSPPPLEGPDEDGLLRWELGLAPGQTQKIVFVYHIRRPQGWQLFQ